MALSLWLVGSVGSAPADATTIEYVAVDLADTTFGEDLWEYRYRVSGFVFDADQGFSIRFDPLLYAGLEDPPPPVGGDWDPLVLQPDPGLPADGAYDALALVNGASLLDLFRVGFVWLGSGAPGSQPFEINQFDSNGNFMEILASGFTAPLQAVPEPPPWSILTSGFLPGLLVIRRKLGVPRSRTGRRA
jgi:hypothetical protein